VSEAMLIERPSAMATYQKRREAELAWSQFRGDRIDDRVPEAAKREVRLLKRSLESSAQQIGAALRGQAWRIPAGDFYFKNTDLGRSRARVKLTRLFSPAVVELKQLGEPLGEAVLARWLQPMGPVTMVAADPSFMQDAVIVHVDGLVQHRRVIVSASMIALECPDHALGRLFQRSPGADASRALNEAASAFLALDVREVIELGHVGRETLVLPAGDGRFLCNVIFGKIRETEGWRVFPRARTWISSAMAGEDQTPLQPATNGGSSMLAAGFTLSGKLSGMASPLTTAELEQLEADLCTNRG